MGTHINEEKRQEFNFSPDKTGSATCRRMAAMNTVTLLQKQKKQYSYLISE
jgi:hypothetical protein